METETQGIPWPKQREPRDYGIAVADAKRLNDCWHELSEAFAARPALEGDEAHWFQQAGASPGNEEWVHQVNSRNVAEIMLRGAIRDRAFPIWLRLAEGEVRADPHAITSVSHKTLATGLYLTENYPKSNLEGRPLWIKNADWHRFYAGLMASRYGEQVAPPAGAEPDEPLTLWLALELRRARAAFDKARKEQDPDFEAKGLRKSGVRVKVTLKSASEICVALADATIAKAAEFSASAQARRLARDEVVRFTKEIASTAIPLAHFVGGDSPSVINAATDRGQTLIADVTGAFKLAEEHQLRADDLAPINSIATANNGTELPIWLNMYQLTAWVLYRDPAIVAKAVDWYGLAGQNMYGTDPKVSGYAPLEKALQSGELIAQGAKRGESFAAIPAVEWTRLRIAPLDMAHQWPYVSIQVSRADAEALFAPAGSQPTRVAEASPKRRAGRTPGSGSYAGADAPLLAEMAEHIASGKAMSPHAAAQLVADRASGGGGFNSKVTRLAKAFRSLERNRAA